MLHLDTALATLAAINIIVLLLAISAIRADYRKKAQP